MATTNGVQTSVKRAADAMLDGNLPEATKEVQVAARQLSEAASRAASGLGTTARQHPVVTGAMLVGLGAVAGALLHSALRPRPTASQVLLRALRDGADATTHTLSSGLLLARRALR